MNCQIVCMDRKINMYPIKKFYITTPIYYVNAKPHIGHAYTTIAADVLARYHKSQNQEAFFLTGTDEHGLKIQKKAEEVGKDPQKFTDEIAGEFVKLWEKLNIQYDNFIRTSSSQHKEAVQKVLQILYDKGAIYKGEYEGWYCVGCEQYKNESDLVEGRCPDHDQPAEKIKEECYMLKLTDVQDELIKKMESDEFQIAPQKYKNEILSFLKNHKLNDISVSRKNVQWGVPLPFEPEQTAYVWIDAFLNYLTGLGWNGEIPLNPPLEKGEVKGDLKFWPPNVQLIGKDILRVHATIWPAILMHLGITLPKILFTHGYLLSGGRKMSKTLGNVITIDEMLEKFGVEGTRYLLMNSGVFGDDGDVAMERIIEKYNSELANGLGNLVSRVIKLYPQSTFKVDKAEIEEVNLVADTELKALENIGLEKPLVYLANLVREDDKFIEENKPWELAKNDQKKFDEVMKKLVLDLHQIARILVPYLPETSEKIKKALKTKKAGILFQRINTK